MIRDNECMLLTARSEDDVSLLEVQIYNEEDAHMYVHHEILLPEFPLSVAWMDYNPHPEYAGNTGNFVAIGTFLPHIEIWDLDVVDALEPVLVLAGDEERPTFGEKKRKKKKKVTAHGGHADAVMGLSWNSQQRNALASSSADHTIKVWDLEKQSCLYTYRHHKDKVQCVEWHPQQSTLMASGAFDQTLAVFDAAAPKDVSMFKLPADVEDISWCAFDDDLIMASTEDGQVTCFDIRNASDNGDVEPLYTLQAHEKQCSCIGFSKCNQQPIMATGSVDSTVKIWNLADNKPSLIVSQDLGVGSVYCLDFTWDSPYVLAAGGQNGQVAVWDLEENEEVEEYLKDM
eukprot:TRINITY_DN2060_c0_g1_i1.p1 TRINITY_DN2060_c0_g1~~TRINITY_DN2060_c0_g1_i1.p1  ORF type:complete len:344 (-),score=131.14 TRINITY_DN2060_c0_g1_i1:289-1320(-)